MISRTCAQYQRPDKPLTAIGQELKVRPWSKVTGALGNARARDAQLVRTSRIAISGRRYDRRVGPDAGAPTTDCDRCTRAAG